MQGLDFCVMDNEKSSGVYVDLQVNPERFTGYTGESAGKVWGFIYQKSCNDASTRSPEWKLCPEKDIFYHIISGIHASISTHIAYDFYNKATGYWERNLQMYIERVGRYKDRVENMFFVYALVYQAVKSIKPQLLKMELSCGDENNESEIKV